MPKKKQVSRGAKAVRLKTWCVMRVSKDALIMGLDLFKMGVALPKMGWCLRRWVWVLPKEDWNTIQTRPRYTGLGWGHLKMGAIPKWVQAYPKIIPPTLLWAGSSQVSIWTRPETVDIHFPR